MLGIKKLIIGLLSVLICFSALAACQTSPTFKRIDAHKGEIYFWPKTYSDGDGKILTMYQPQITEWTKFRQLYARAAIAYKTPLDVKPTFGTMVLHAKTAINVKSRQAKATEIKIQSLSFSGLSINKIETIKESMRDIFPAKGMILSLDRLIANFKRTMTIKEAIVKSDPPPIFVSKDPAILINFNGKPIWSPIKGNKLQFAVNTNWDLFWDKAGSTYYLRNFDGWMSAPNLTGPWQAGPNLPRAFKQLPNDENWKEVKAHIPGRKLSSKAAPNVYVSYKPSELIVLEGEPDLRVVNKTFLMWVANTDSDLFFSTDDKFYYYLVSGRWFRSRELSNNAKWEFITHRLPEDFKAIPIDSPRARVRVSVPGTPEAKSAIILAQIPQKAEVKKGALKPVVDYIGEPQFKSIEGTQLAYAVNTSSDVIRFNNIFYLCQNGVWFVAKIPNGPWQLATQMPGEIYTIPPSSPKYHITYVYIYDTGPNTVTYGYTTGYSNVYVSYGVVVYGSGYYYPPYWYYSPYYYYPHYYHNPYTYGSSSYYNPNTGTYGNAGWAYGPYGGVGYGSAYNPTTGAYARGAAAYGPNQARGWVEAYNPQTNTHVRSVQGTNYYQSWGATAVRRDDQWVATAHYKGEQGQVRKFAGSGGHEGFIGYDQNNLYAGKDGNVYRRNADGWQKYDNGNWNNVEKPIQRDLSKQSSDRIKQRRSEGTSINKGQFQNRRSDRPQKSANKGQFQNRRSDNPQKSAGSLSEQLNRDHRARQYGQDRLNKTRSWQNRGGLNRGGGQRGSRVGRGGGGQRGSRMGRGRR